MLQLERAEDLKPEDKQGYLLWKTSDKSQGLKKGLEEGAGFSGCKASDDLKGILKGKK